MEGLWDSVAEEWAAAARVDCERWGGSPASDAKGGVRQELEAAPGTEPEAEAEPEPDAYVLEVTHTSDGAHVIAGVFPSSLVVLDRSRLHAGSGGDGGDTGGDACVRVIEGAHEGGLRALQPSSADEPALCFSASQDGAVKLWDLRTPGHRAAQCWQFPDLVWSAAVGLQDTLLAASVGSDVLFVDTRGASSSMADQSGRHGRPERAADVAGYLGLYDDVHTDDVMHLCFSQACPTHLMTGGADGLACVYDTSVPADGEALVSVLNADCELRRCGFCGPSGEAAFVVSAIETLSLWHIPSAQRVGELTVDAPAWRTPMNYVVDCAFLPDQERFVAVMGTYNGEARVYTVTPESVVLEARLRGQPGAAPGHSSVVRCCDWYVANSQFSLVTGSEDCTICSWQRADATPAPTASEGASGAIGDDTDRTPAHQQQPQRKQPSHGGRRHQKDQFRVSSSGRGRGGRSGRGGGRGGGFVDYHHNPY